MAATARSALHLPTAAARIHPGQPSGHSGLATNSQDTPETTPLTLPSQPAPRRGGWPLSWLRRGSPSLLPRPWAGPPSGNDCSFINPWSILHSVVSAIFISSRKPRSRVGGAAPSVWRERPGPKVGHGRGLTGPGHRLRPGYNCPELSEWDRKGHVPRGGQGSGVSGQPGRAESPGSTHGKWD